MRMLSSMFRVIFFISLFGALFNSTSKKCCKKKNVGGQTYHLVENNDNDATSSLGCKNACSYVLENDTDLAKKYCFAPGEQEAKCLSSEVCCEERTIRGQLFRNVRFDGEIPEFCVDSCIYSKKTNISIEFEQKFCFTQTNNLAPINPITECEDKDKLLSLLGGFDSATEEEAETTDVGCSSYDHLQKFDSSKGKCAYYWNRPKIATDNFGYIFGFNSCKGPMNIIEENERWSATDCKQLVQSHFGVGSSGPWLGCKNFKSFKDIIVSPGCSLYLYGQPNYNLWSETRAKNKLEKQISKLTNYIEVLAGPATIYNFRPPGGVQSFFCSCDLREVSPNLQSSPKDGWEVILECDNREGAGETTCEYVKTVGTTFATKKENGGSESSTSSSTTSYGGEVSVSGSAFGVSASVKATFSKELGESATTNVNWNTLSTNTFDESVSMKVSEIVPAGLCVKVEQVVGYIGEATVRTNVYRMTSNCKTTSSTIIP